MSTVLVADDNATNRKLALRVLGQAGHQLLEATGGESAVQQARERLPNLVVMDVQMPGMDGLAAVRALRADPTTAAIKVLALTALAMKGDEERILAAGFDACLTKPYPYRDLLAVVQSLLR